MKRLSTLFAIAAAISMACISCSPKVAPADNVRKDIVILYDNDVHCAVDGYAKMAALKNDMLKNDIYLALASSGDFVQGGSLGAISKGGYMIDVINKVGYDVVTLGNHEFDYGIPRLKELVAKLTATTVVCNLYDLTTDSRMFAPYRMFDFGDTPVAVIGVATPYSFISSTPAYFQNEDGEYIYSLCADNLYDVVQNMVDDARQQGAEYVVVISHLGCDVGFDPINSLTLIANTDGIDVVLDGHSHTVMERQEVDNKSGQKTVLTSTGSHFDNIGCLTIGKDGTITTKLLDMKEYDKADPAVAAVIDSVKNEYKIMGSRVIGHSDAFLSAKQANGEWIVRNNTSGIGDFLADAFRTVLGADIAVMGGGSIRSNMKDGEITFNDIYSVFPFENTAGVATMSGQKVLDMLEFSVSASPVDFGGFLHPSGITFDVDNSIESPVVVDVNKIFQYIDKGERRISNVKVLDAKSGEYLPIDPDATYTVAGSTYLLKSNGDGYALLNGVPVNDVGALDTQIVEQYIREYLGGNIPSRYAQPENRIRFK